MTDAAIVVRRLSKRYKLGAMRSLDRSLREAISGGVRNLFASSKAKQEANEFWALRDIDFSVGQGEVVGIIGRNGAGKSTLLKILSRVTDPTQGEATINGRVGSLLEVGTGFHPELSGRENIFLNGAILGMSRREIRSKFDDIVAFAEIEKFIDTPVKRYSSGMYVRLAFAVAAHLEPEILMVDEVLAVGDAAFQKKCLGKMGEVAKTGRTVLFVSHNMSAVRNLCPRSIWLEGGKLIKQGQTQQIADQYLQSMMDVASVGVADRTDRGGDGGVCITGIAIENASPNLPVQSGSRLKVTLHYRNDGPLRNPQFLVGIYDYNDTGLYLLDTDATGELPQTLPAEGTLVCYTDAINLTPGRCYVNIALKRAGAIVDYVDHASYFDVEADDAFGLRHTPPRSWVMCLLRQQWELVGQQRMAA